MKQGHGHTGRRNLPEGELKWQLRVNLSDDFAAAARENVNDPKLQPLLDVLAKYDSRLKHQEMAFSDFVPHFKEKERPGLHRKTAATLRLLKYAEDHDDLDATIEALKLFEAAATERVERTRLCVWTEDTLLQPGMQDKYSRRFSIYADGGKEVYDKDVADSLEADLQPLVESGMILDVHKFDSDPANNPQPPAKFHMGN